MRSVLDDLGEEVTGRCLGPCLAPVAAGGSLVRKQHKQQQSWFKPWHFKRELDPADHTDVSKTGGRLTAKECAVNFVALCCGSATVADAAPLVSPASSLPPSVQASSPQSACAWP